MTFKVHEKGFEEMSDTRNGPAHSQQSHPPIGGEISHVRVVVGEPETSLNLHRPQLVRFAYAEKKMIERLMSSRKICFYLEDTQRP